MAHGMGTLMQVPEHKLLLQKGEIHLYASNPLSVTNTGLLTQYQEMLSEEEEKKRARYVFEKDCHRYLVTRAMIRSLLSQYGEYEPAEWRFTAGKWDKPEICVSQNPQKLRFNISHTDGMICCVITRELDIGVDVESTHRKGEWVRIAHRYFSASEEQELTSQPWQSQRSRFFDYWTLKESYIKACGMGLAIALRDFSFRFQPLGTVDIEFAAGRIDDPRLWNFCTLLTAADFKISIGIKGKSNRVSPQMVVREGVPLDGWQTVHFPSVYMFKD